MSDVKPKFNPGEPFRVRFEENGEPVWVRFGAGETLDLQEVIPEDSVRESMEYVDAANHILSIEPLETVEDLKINELWEFQDKWEQQAIREIGPILAGVQGSNPGTGKEHLLDAIARIADKVLKGNRR